MALLILALLQRIDRKSGSAGMPRPISYAVFCLKKKIYSLRASIEAVLGYLDTVDPAAAARARQRYACFDHFGQDPQAYGYATTIGMSSSCEDDVLAQLIELRRRAAEYAARDGRVDPDATFSAEQNARLITNAEACYRAMFTGRDTSWNLRDTHMADTLN